MRSRNGIALVGGALLVAALSLPAAAQGPTVEVLAEGLNAPRGLALAADGSVYVVEAGTGGDACMGDGEAEVCMGLTGSVTQITDGSPTQVLTGLPSISLSGGAEVVGPSDVAFIDDSSFFVTLNLGGDPAQRADMPEEQQSAGWLLKASTDGTSEPFADIAAFESSDNPEPTLVDSNPYSVAVVDGGAIVADAGGNSLLMVDESGVVSLIAAFPPTMHEFPAEMLAAMGPPPGEEGEIAAEGEAAAAEGEAAPEDGMIPLPVESVPTSVVVGPDGAYYMGELTGGPFPVGGASVWRVDAATGEATPYATGFTNIIDIAFGPDGTLYVAEIVHEGLMTVFAAGGAPVGAILSVPPGGGDSTVLVNDERVMALGGIVVAADGTIYASAGTLMPGGGSVVKISP